ncbi:hypothetical protein FQN60_014418, partial [Etheostoma spectabile]
MACNHWSDCGSCCHSSRVCSCCQKKELVRQTSDPDDHIQRQRRRERGCRISIQLPRPGERAGNGDPHEQGEDPRKRQHRGVHRHHARGVARERTAG